jgi:hypothetical protein
MLLLPAKAFDQSKPPNDKEPVGDQLFVSGQEKTGFWRS